MPCPVCRPHAARSGDALVLEGVTRTFGALRAIEDVSLSVAAGERRAVIGANGAGKTTLFNVITGDFPATAGPRALLRRGRHRDAAPRAHPHGPAPHLPVLAAVPRPHGARQPLPGRARRGARALRLPPPARRAPLARGDRRPARARAAAPRSPSSRCRALSHGQQRQLEIGMALAGAPRLILFDEPAAGLSPAERRELVALLAALPAHMGFIIIEHDLDIALRVVERVTVMHNGRVLKHGTPAEIESDAEVQAIYMGGGRTDALVLAAAPPRRRRADPGRREARRLLRPRPRAAGRLAHASTTASLAVVGRNGMGKTTLCNAITGLVPASGSVRLAGEEILGLPPHAITDRGVGYVPQGRRVWPSLTVDEHLRLARSGRSRPVDDRAHLPTVPAARRAAAATAAPSSPAASSRCSRSRARCSQPVLLVMDEPTEGLAPVIVQQVRQ